MEAWVVLGLLLGGCASVRTVARSAPAEDLEHLGAVLPGRVEIGVARPGGNQVVLSYDVETHAARELRVLPEAVTWLDAETGHPRRAPLLALRWIRWTPADAPRLVPALELGGLGGLGGAVVGALLGFVFGYGPDVCVGGGYSASGQVGYFEQRCFAAWPPRIGVGAAIGAAMGLVGGAILGAVLGERQLIEFTGPVVPGAARSP